MVRSCSTCGSAHLQGVLRLGSSPPACSMGHIAAFTLQETHYPLDLLVCQDCGLAQLSAIVDPEIVFHPAYPYSSGNSKGLHDNFENLAASVPLRPGSLVVDIGANDGTLLRKFTNVRKVAVEPTNQIAKALPEAVDIYQSFFGLDVAKRIVEGHGHADLVTACNVLAHVRDIDDAMAGIRLLLGDSGQLVAENHDLKSIVQEGQWDTIYHEHLRYYDPHSFAELLRRHGLVAERQEDIPTHGGSFRTYARPGTGEPWPRRDYDWDALARRAGDTRAELRGLLADIHEQGDRCWGIGAAARATTVIGYCGISSGDVQLIVEVPGSDKIGRLMPGTSIVVQQEDILFSELQPRYAILFSWHLADYIVPALRKKGYRGRIILPLPKPRIIDDRHV